MQCRGKWGASGLANGLRCPFQGWIELNHQCDADLCHEAAPLYISMIILKNINLGFVVAFLCGNFAGCLLLACVRWFLGSPCAWVNVG